MNKRVKRILCIVFVTMGVIFIPQIANAEVSNWQIQLAQQQVQQNKCNLQFNTELREHFIERCGFTDEEAEIYRMRARGYSLVRIGVETGYSESTVQARIRSIKRKILSI